jgi:hypothetical protein
MISKGSHQTESEREPGRSFLHCLDCPVRRVDGKLHSVGRWRHAVHRRVDKLREAVGHPPVLLNVPPKQDGQWSVDRALKPLLNWHDALRLACPWCRSALRRDCGGGGGVRLVCWQYVFGLNLRDLFGCRLCVGGCGIRAFLSATREDAQAQRKEDHRSGHGCYSVKLAVPAPRSRRLNARDRDKKDCQPTVA